MDRLCGILSTSYLIGWFIDGSYWIYWVVELSGSDAATVTKVTGGIILGLFVGFLWPLHVMYQLWSWIL